MIKVGNFYFFLEWFIAVALFIIVFLILRRKDKKTQYKVLLTWCFINFALHFLKQLVYHDVSALDKSTAENICAVSTMVFPFIMMIKKDIFLHDFMFLIGIVGGLAALIYPTEAIDESILSFETIRFYFCHISILEIPLLLAVLNIYRPKLKNWWIMPICFLGYESIICLNTAFLCFSGLEVKDGFTALELFLDKNYMNNSFVFGPTDDMGTLSTIMSKLTFPFLKKDILHIYNGKEIYWPVIWLSTHSYMIFVPLYLLLTLPFIKRSTTKIKS